MLSRKTSLILFLCMTSCLLAKAEERAAPAMVYNPHVATRAVYEPIHLAKTPPNFRLVAAEGLKKPESLPVVNASEGDSPKSTVTPEFKRVDTTGQTNIVRKLTNASDKMEMIVNSSRIVTLDKPIPQAQVNNPEVIRLTPLSPTQIQIAALKPGVTQVNLWGKDGKIYSIDVLVVGDARQLDEVLKAQFPESTIKVIPIAEGSIYLSGTVDRPESVPHIVNIAKNYYPEVINNLSVGGVQQVLLHVKVMEVSRTKLRKLGVDWALFSGGGLSAWSRPNGLANIDAEGVRLYSDSSETFFFRVLTGGQFWASVEALRQNNLLKIHSEPTLVTVSGEPATYLVGGEVPYTVPQSLGTTSIEFKKYGTQLEFVPVVMGNGTIRMDVHPQISELDWTVSYDTGAPGFKTREVQTTLEMQAGQTLAVAGLLQNRTESETKGIPLLMDIPYLGAIFRGVHEQNNEVEMIILVTPEVIEPLNPCEVPQGGPGTNSCRPNDCELYIKGHIETPKRCGGCATSNCPGDPGTTNGYADMVASRNEGSMPGMIVPSGANQDGSIVEQPVRVARRPGNATISGDNSPRRQSQTISPKPAFGQGGVVPAQKAPLPGFQGENGYSN
jgi:pilus assembly protein CpaC